MTNSRLKILLGVFGVLILLLAAYIGLYRGGVEGIASAAEDVASSIGIDIANDGDETPTSSPTALATSSSLSSGSSGSSVTATTTATSSSASGASSSSSEENRVTPVINSFAVPGNVSGGQQVTFNWNVSNADCGVFFEGASMDPVDELVVNLPVSMDPGGYSYTLVAHGAPCSDPTIVEKSATMTVSANITPTIKKFTGPNSGSGGTYVLIEWDVENAYCGVFFEGSEVDAKGSIDFTWPVNVEPGNYKYTLEAKGDPCSNTDSETITIKVEENAVTPNIDIRGTITATPGQLVFVEWDVTDANCGVFFEGQSAVNSGIFEFNLPVSMEPTVLVFEVEAWGDPCSSPTKISKTWSIDVLAIE